MVAAAVAAPSALQAVDVTCPASATATGVGVSVAALRTNGVPVGTNTIAPCEPIILQMAIEYIPIDPITGGANAAFVNGRMLLTVGSQASVNVTPIDTNTMTRGVPLIGPEPCVNTNGAPAVPFFLSDQLIYTVTLADALAGGIEVFADYLEGDALMGDGFQGVVSGSQAFPAQVRPNVSCTIAPTASNICAGARATFCVTGANGTPFAPDGGPGNDGIGTYRFTWTGPNGFTSTNACITISNAAPSASGVYRVVITDYYGCTNTCEATLNVRPNPVCAISPPAATNCFGPGCVTYTVSPSGGTGPYTVVCSGPGLPATLTVTTSNTTFSVCATNLGTNVYSCAITDANGCVGSCTATFIVNPNPTCTIAPLNTNICFGASASLVVTPTSGRAPYTIVLSRAGVSVATNTTSASATFTVTPPATGANSYLATITDANGCVGTCSAVVVANPNPICTIAPSSTNICLGATANLAVTAQGGVGPYVMVLRLGTTPLQTNTNSGTFTFVVAPPATGTNTYTVLITDANGCIGTCNATVVINPNPICTIAPTATNICLGASASLAVTPANGTAPYTVVLSTNGVPFSTNITSATATFTVTPPTTGAHIFTAVVRDANGCVGSCTATVTVNPNPSCAIFASATNLCLGASATLAVTPTGGTAPYTVVWSTNGVPLATNITSSTTNFTVTPPATGPITYTAVVRDANGCVGSCAVTLLVNSNPTCAIAPAATNICLGGSATFTVTAQSGTAPYTIVLSRLGAPIATNVTSGTATFTVTPTSAGVNTYAATVRDANGCLGTCTITVTANPVPACTIAPTATNICLGASASLTVTPTGGTGPYVVVLSRSGVALQTNTTSGTPTVFTVTPNTLGASVYIATVTDANGCVGTCPATVTVNPNPACTIVPASTNICLGSSAALTVVPSGGTAPYTIVLSRNGVPLQGNTSSGAITFTVTPNVTGTNHYLATVTDANGCVGTCPASIVVYPTPACAIAPSSTNICLGTSATLAVTPSGGTGPYVVVLSRGGVALQTNTTSGTAVFTVTPTTAGPNAYVATVTDTNGCIGTCNATVTANPVPACAIAPSSTNICLGATARLTVTPSGGTGPYTIVLSIGGVPIQTNTSSGAAVAFQVTPSILGANSYLATVTDANGCIGTCPAIVVVNPTPACTLVSTPTNICLGTSATLAVTPSGGTAPYVVVLSLGGVRLQTNTTSGTALFTVTPTAAGTNNYLATVTDANGCVGTCPGLLVVNPNPVCSISAPTTNICLGTTASLTVTPAGGTAPYTVVLSRSGVPLETNTSASPVTFIVTPALGPNTYVAAVTDANGCSGTCVISVTAHPNPTCAITPPLVTICPDTCVTLTVTPSGGLSPYRVVLDGRTNTTSSTTSFSVCPPSPGTNLYLATVIDARGCLTTCEARVVVREDVNPDLTITKICPPIAPAPGEMLCFSTIVSNSGNVVVSNIIVRNDRPTPNTTLTNIVRLAAGESLRFTNCYLVPSNVCSVADTLTAAGTDICGLPVQATSGRIVCPVNVLAGLSVTKFCPPRAVAPGGLLVISGRITNTGNITITNVTVTNVISVLGEFRHVFGPTNLAPRASATFTNSYTVPLDSCGPYGDTLIANGYEICGGVNISAISSIECPGTNAPALDVAVSCPTLIPATNEIMTVTGTLTNRGNISITNIIVRNVVSAIGRDVIVSGPLTLSPGAGISFSDSFNTGPNCVPMDTRITATGAEQCEGLTVTASAAADCPIICCPTNELLVVRAIPDRDCRPTGGEQAVWLRHISTNLIFYPQPGSFIEDPVTGTARFTGMARSLTNLSSGFIVDVTLSGRTRTPSTSPPGPKLDLEPECYVSGGGSIDPSTWYYYSSFTGTLTGFGFWQGAVLTIEPFGPYFQVGFGANGKNANLGFSAWFTYTVVSQPSNGARLERSSQGDFNVDLLVCVPTGEIGDFVWNDLNENGIQDAGEPGLPNVEVRLANCTNNVTMLVTNTDSSGFYFFRRLLGDDLRVIFVRPTGYTFTSPNVGADDSLDSDADPATGRSHCVDIPIGVSDLTIDAGLVVEEICPTDVFGAFSDPTYRPADKPPDRHQALWMRGVSTNLIFEAGAPGQFIENSDGTATLTGRTVSLTNSSSGFTVNVSFSGRTDSTPSGSPLLELDPRAYLENGGPIDPSTWYYYTSFSGTLTGFGIWEGAVITLVRYGPAFQVGAGANGKNLRWGASGWFTWTVQSHPLGGRFADTEGQGDFNLDLFVCPLAEIGDFVWEDINRNGLQDADEPGLPGVEVRLADCTGQLISVTNTDEAGRYIFTNQPGIYNVTFVLPSGFLFTTANAGANDALDSDATGSNGVTRCFTLLPGEVNHTIDAGLVRLCPIQVLGAFSDPTYRPADKPPDRHQALWMRGVSTNLIFEASDPGEFVEHPNGTARLTGRTVSLTNTSSGFIVDVSLSGRTTSRPSGSPLLELDPRAYVQNGGPIDPSTWYYYTSFTGTLTGFGIWEGAVIRITRYGPSFQIGIGANGKNQTFGASAWFTWNVLSQPLTGRFAETTGQGDFNLDFIGCPPGVLSGLVWDDLNRNGIQDAGEPGLPNVQVSLARCGGAAVTNTATSTTGFYSFTNIAPGSYRVTFVAPFAYAFTLRDAGGNDALDSDADAGGITACVTVESDQVNNSVAAGLVPVPSPALRGFQIVSAGQCRILIDGAIGHNYIVEGSVDLETWNTIATVYNADGILEFVDTAGHPHCFYRVKLAP